MKTTAKTILVVILAGATAALTMLIRIPMPATSGYVNLGDVAVIFCGLFLGGRLGALAGGIGSALADLMTGTFIYIPITFIAKGLEAWIAGTLGRKHFLWLFFATAVMVGSYFIAEVFFPGMGLSAALQELIFNGIQGIAGALGGYFIYRSVSLALPQLTNDQHHS